MHSLAERLKERGSKIRKSVLRWRWPDGQLMLEAAAEIDRLRKQHADLTKKHADLIEQQTELPERYALAENAADELARMVGIDCEPKSVALRE